MRGPPRFPTPILLLLRHAGIDFLTIAGSLGNKDGAILIDKVYRHLLDRPRRKTAAKLLIGIAPVGDLQEARALRISAHLVLPKSQSFIC